MIMRSAIADIGKSFLIQEMEYQKSKEVARTGIEPATQGFSVLCSTDWAIWPQASNQDRKSISLKQQKLFQLFIYHRLRSKALLSSIYNARGVPLEIIAEVKLSWFLGDFFEIWTFREIHILLW
jgi:hypothetical protein